MKRSIVIAAALLAPVGTALADEPPTPAPRAGFTLPRGAVGAALTLEVEMSAGRAGEPVSLSPDVSYGATDDLTVALVHSRFGVTGFRAAAGGGLCVSGETGGCGAVYDNVGVEAWHRLPAGSISLAVVGGVHALDLDAGYVSAKLGVKARVPVGPLAIVAIPAVLVAVTERDADAMTGARNKDTLWVPVLATYRPTAALTVGVGSGVKGPWSGFADAWQLPVGFVAQYAVDPLVSVGASWVFGQLVGGADDPPAPAPPVTGPDLRGAQVWVSYVK